MQPQRNKIDQIFDQTSTFLSVFFFQNTDFRRIAASQRCSSFSNRSMKNCIGLKKDGYLTWTKLKPKSWRILINKNIFLLFPNSASLVQLLQKKADYYCLFREVLRSSAVFDSN